MSQAKRVRPLLGFSKSTDAQVLERGRSVQKGLAEFPEDRRLPVDLAAFVADLDGFSEATTAALDGSKKAIANRRKFRQRVISTLRLLGSYVEAAADGDLGVVLSSGFEAVSVTQTAPQPLPRPAILRVDQGNSGQLLVHIEPLPKARSFELRYGALENGGTPGAWTTMIVVTVKQATAIHNLTPGAIYTFQVRAVNKLGYTDWSDAVNRMCI
jgi:hypothetical protein